MKRPPPAFRLFALAALFAIPAFSPAQAPKPLTPEQAEKRKAYLEARYAEQAKSVQSAGIDRVMSKETPPEVQALPIFGSIDWTLKEMPHIEKGPRGGLSGAGMVVVDGKIYVMGGFIPLGDETEDASRRTSRWVHRYDPTTEQWTRLPDLPGRREYTRATVHGSTIYLMGGGAQMQPFSSYPDVFALDVSKVPLQWQSAPPMKTARTHQSVGVVGSWLVSAGGNRYDVAEKGYSPKTILNSTERLDVNHPEKGWQQAAPIPGHGRGWSAASVVNGKFYMLAGVTWTPEARVKLQETLCYDQEKDAWQRLAPPPAPVSGWESDVFDNRYLIAIGGVASRWSDIPFVYDTKKDTWLRIDSPVLPGGFYNDCGVCIIGDTIYVAGGEGPKGSHFNHFLIGKIKPRPEPQIVAVPPAGSALDIGSRWEMFVDEYLVSQRKGLNLKLTEPVKREIVLVTDKSWEGPTCAYFSAIQDGKKVRLYYRGSAGGSDHSEDQVTCVAESSDGIHFTRPKIGLIEAGGTKENNVIWRGVESHNFAVFLDGNPAAKADERYKALGGVKQPGKNWMTGETPGGLYAFASADGLHWHKMRPETVMTKGAFDSQNVAFWDAPRNRYASYTRIFTDKIRAIQSSSSLNFLQWSDATVNRYAKGVPAEHFYTSATVPCPGAPNLLLSFPKRFVSTRKKVATHSLAGVSDAIFMSSRDGVNWDRTFLEAWVRPGHDEKNWTDRNSMTAAGIIETAPDEWSLYVSEHYRSPDHRLRRVTVRKQGFASMHADASGGEFVTEPLRFAGDRLLLNYATSAAGSIQVEIQDEAGKPMPGFTLADMPELYGDELEAPATWKTGNNLSALKGKTVRLRFVMKDADLYALRFAP